VGGSCTGVFAAVGAARMGASVVLVEKTNCFGGMATNGLVLIWHSLLDTEHRARIIGGLTGEVMERLDRRGAVEKKSGSHDVAFIFNTEELKIELDALIIEHRILPMLHTLGCAPLMDNGRIRAVAVENKDGRAAVAAEVFVDATGDGDIAVRAGVPCVAKKHLQPPTMCAKILGFRRNGVNFGELYRQHAAEFGLERDSGWDCPVPGLPGISMAAQTHVFGINAASASDLTRGEMEGRRQIRAIMDMVRKYGGGDPPVLVQLASALGVRETRTLRAAYCLTEEDVLNGVRFHDAVANGSYRLDVHAPDGGGFLFKYLDGRLLWVHHEGCREGRWRPETDRNPTFYQIPYRCLFHPCVPNLLFAGRCICADEGAFGAIRVMVNANQTGEAAGTAAAIASRSGKNVQDVDPRSLREALADGGSVIL